MSVKVDEALVVRLANLAHLELAPAETAALTDDLRRILDYIDVLAEADVDATEPLASVCAERERRREDEPRPSLDRDLALSQAPRAAEGGFVVPTFVDEG